MSPIEEALAQLHLEDKPNISRMAKKFQVDRTNLGKRFRNESQSATQKHENQQILAPPQERTLITHINRLSEIGLPPTPAMLRNFAAEIAGEMPGKNWSHRFCQRHKDQLLSRYLKPLDNSRKKAESSTEFEHWFELIDQKIKQYGILPENTYNMDEKGFLIGFLSKAKRVFTKDWFESNNLIGNIQDGSREWITLVATICADGSALPPALIYMAKSGDIQDSWVQDLDYTVHKAYFASSPSGWTNDSLGFEWLTKVFDRETKSKARQGRDWRLLIVDGHGSHINIKFLDWCLEHHIMVAVYPPHSTHRLQPLDVSLFSPLAIYYSQELDAFLHRCQGLLTIGKRDFFGLFWPAYLKAFTQKNISGSWIKTGLCPLDASAVLKLSKKVPTLQEVTRPSSGDSSKSAISASDWRTIRALVKDVLNKQNDSKVTRLNNTVLTLTTKVSLLKSQNDGYRRALTNEKKKRKRNKGLFEEIRAQDGHGATFFSPTKIQTAKDFLATKEEAKEQAQRDRLAQKEARQALQLEAQRLKDERKVERARVASEKLAEKEAKALQREQAIEGKKVAQQLKLASQLLPNKPKSPPKKSPTKSSPKKQSERPPSPKVSEVTIARSGRVVRRPNHLSD